MKHLRFKMPKRVWVPALVAVLALVVVCGGVLAAVQLTLHGSVAVVSEGGGGGTQIPTYTLSVYDVAEEGTPLTGASTLFDLGDIHVGYQESRTVYLHNTGTGDIDVTVTVVGLEPVTGSFAGEGTYTVLTTDDRIPVTLTFTASSTVAPADAFDVTFDVTPYTP